MGADSGVEMIFGTPYVVMVHGSRKDSIKDDTDSPLGFISTVLVMARDNHYASVSAKKKLRRKYFKMKYDEMLGKDINFEIDEVIEVSFSKFLFDKLFNLPLLKSLVPSTPDCNFIFYSE